ncbi:MAG: DUF4332 domain-containing protein [Geitlerinemataceae cyanobacterium]
MPANCLTSKDWLIHQLPGLDDRDCQKLADCGIYTTRQLLQQGRRADRQPDLAARLQVRLQQLKKWVALADLARIPNVGCIHCGLLLHGGVGSVAQLSQLPVHRLHPQLLRFHVATLQRKDLCPTVDEVAVWIQQARNLV